MTKERYQVSLKAILRRDDGRMLILKGRKGSLFEGVYDLPGGRIENTELETPMSEILTREIREEIGDNARVDVDERPVAFGRHFSRTGIPTLFIFFGTRLLSDADAIAISDEHAGFLWVDLATIDLNTHFKLGILDGIREYLSRQV